MISNIESSIIGCFLKSESAFFDVAKRIKSDHFTLDKYKHAFNVIEKHISEGHSCDLTLLSTKINIDIRELKDMRLYAILDNVHN